MMFYVEWRSSCMTCKLFFSIKKKKKNYQSYISFFIQCTFSYEWEYSQQRNRAAKVLSFWPLTCCTPNQMFTWSDKITWRTEMFHQLLMKKFFFLKTLKAQWCPLLIRRLYEMFQMRYLIPTPVHHVNPLKHNN